MYEVGDLVRIRMFDDIDTDDIGDVGYNARSCYNIAKSYINRAAEKSNYLTVVSRERRRGTYIYRLSSETDPDITGWYWAQGMLAPYEEDDLPDADPDSLLMFLGVGEKRKEA